MKVFRDMRLWRAQRPQGRLGFVPTMGALHQGHLSLLKAAQECEATVVSLFVNPTQFDDPQDLRAYPKDLDTDLALLEAAGCDYALVPTEEQIYPHGYRYRVSESELSRRFCGAHRPGHFDGVLTVVLKLLMLVRPWRAYFGEKDFQQMRLVQGMAEDFFLDLEIVPVPIVREPDGLAMSSRNARFDPEARARATHFPRILGQSAAPEEIARQLQQAGFQVDYVEDWQGRRLAAARVASAGGVVRLIDNLPL